ncbi:unnamed protein product [Sphagnum balticum]
MVPCASVFNSNYISGGSSSGSAVAVASGLLDPVASPAMFNNVIGLKPTRGLLSTRGVVPACRTLDCVSIFAETASDAATVLSLARGFDELDPYSRVPSISSGASPWIAAPTFRFGVPTLATRLFFGDVDNPVLFEKAIEIIKHDLGGEAVEFDLTHLFLLWPVYSTKVRGSLRRYAAVAIAVPAGIRPDGYHFSLTLIGNAFTDDALLLLADRVHRSLATTIGGLTRSLSNTPKLLSQGTPLNCFLLAVVGAHLSDQPLNYQLTERNARLVRTCRTSHEYRLYALKGLCTS